MLGDKILNAIGNDDIISTRNYLIEFRNFLAHFRSEKKMKETYDTEFIIGGVFHPRRYYNLPHYERATFQLIYDFNDFMIKCCEADPAFVFQNGKRFIYELANFFPDFFRGWCAQTKVSYAAFADIKNLFMTGCIPDDAMLKNNLTTFGIRQVLENKFRRVWGIIDIATSDNKPIKVDHSFFVNFLLENQKFYVDFPSNGNELQDIYFWTNHSIHNMTTPYCWEIWKALQIVDAFFCPPAIDFSKLQAGCNWSRHQKIAITQSNFNRLRNRLGGLLARRQKKDVIVFYDHNPEIHIVDRKPDIDKTMYLEKRYRYHNTCNCFRLKILAFKRKFAHRK